MDLIDEIAISLGKIGRCIFEVVRTIYTVIVELVVHVKKWAQTIFSRFAEKIKEGWRVYYLDVDVEKIPPSVIPRESLHGARKVSLGVMTDRNLTPKVVDQVFVHDTEDDDLKEMLGSKRSVELVL